MTDSKRVTGKEVSKAAIYREAVQAGLKSRHFWQVFIFGLLLIYCTLFYYFGELAGLLKWETLRMDFFYGAHDIQRGFFIVPIIYAAYVFGTKGSVIATLVAAIAIFTRVMVTASGADPIWRSIMFIIIAGAIGYLTAWLRRLRFLV